MSDTPAPAVETPVVPPEAPKAEETPKPPEPSVGSGFAVLSKKEKAFRQEREQWKAQRAKEEAEMASWRKEREAAKARDELKKSKPLDWLKEQGLTYEQLTEIQLAGGEPTPALLVDDVKGQVEALRKQLADEKREAAEAERARLQKETEAILEQFGQQCEAHVKAAGDKYELTNAYGQHALVRQVVEEHFNQHKKVLTIDEAADIVEKYLEKEAEKLIATKKFKAKVGAPSAPVNAPPAKPSIEAQPRTLSNSIPSQPSTIHFGGRTEADREARALKALLDSASKP